LAIYYCFSITYNAFAFSYCSFNASAAVLPFAIALEKVNMSLKDASFCSRACNPYVALSAITDASFLPSDNKI